MHHTSNVTKSRPLIRTSLENTLKCSIPRNGGFGRAICINRLGWRFLIEHQAEFDLQRVVEMPGVEVDEFLGFIKPINQGVAVDMK